MLTKQVDCQFSKKQLSLLSHFLSSAVSGDDPVKQASLSKCEIAISTFYSQSSAFLSQQRMASPKGMDVSMKPHQ